jgi:hypothetical protein
MTDYKALCAELYELDACRTGIMTPETHSVHDARAALAQPEPEGPSDKELRSSLMPAGFQR